MDDYRIRRIAREVVHTELASNWWHEQAHRWWRDTALEHHVTDSVRAQVPDMVNSLVPNAVSKEILSWVSGHGAVARLLEEHRRNVQSMVDSQITTGKSQLNAIATDTAAKMARSDDFGSIYGAITQEAKSCARAAVTEEIDKLNKKHTGALRELKAKQDEIDDLKDNVSMVKGMVFVSFVAGIAAFVMHLH